MLLQLILLRKSCIFLLQVFDVFPEHDTVLSLHLLQIFWTKRQGQQLPHSLYYVRSIGLCQVHIPVSAKLSHDLSASSTRCNKLTRQVTCNGNGSEVPTTIRDGLLNRRPLSTDAQSVACILHIASRIDLPLTGQKGSSHPEVTVGTVCRLLGFVACLQQVLNVLGLCWWNGRSGALGRLHR